MASSNVVVVGVDGSAESASALRYAMPPVTEVVVRPGAAVEVLVDGSGDAEVLVVGHRGREDFASALLGSVGLGCVLHARCPVVVVRPARVPECEIVPRAPEPVLATALGPTG